MGRKEKKFWFSVADSDVLLWSKGVAIGLGLKVLINEPDIYPLAIQGPKAESLMVALFGEKIKSIKFFHFDNLSCKDFIDDAVKITFLYFNKS